MYDGLRIVLSCDRDVYDQLRIHAPELVEHIAESTGQSLCETVEYKHLRITIKRREPRYIIIIDGSLHRFFTGGKNDNLFTFHSVRRAVDELVRSLGPDFRRSKIVHLELGVNIPAKCPRAIVDAAILYHGRTPTQDVRRKDKYYKEWEFEDFTIKLYEKGKSLLRFEIRLERLRKHPYTSFLYLEDLESENKFIESLRYLYDSVTEFIFVPAKGDIPLPDKIRDKWGEFKSYEYWLNCTRQQRHRAKLLLEDAITNCRMINWRDYLRRGILEQGALMLGTSLKYITDTFSALGLPVENVAEVADLRDVKTAKTPGPLRQCRRVCLPDYGLSIYNLLFNTPLARPPPREDASRFA